MYIDFVSEGETSVLVSEVRQRHMLPFIREMSETHGLDTISITQLCWVVLFISYVVGAPVISHSR